LAEELANVVERTAGGDSALHGKGAHSHGHDRLLVETDGLEFGGALLNVDGGHVLAHA